MGFLDVMKNIVNWTPQGSPEWSRVQSAKHAEGELDIEKQQEQRRAQEADQAFAEHMQSLGAKPSFSGAVKDDQTVPQLPGLIGGGTSFQTVRPVDKSRVIKHKTAEGETVEFELPTMEEQVRRQMMLNAPGLQAQEEHAQRTAQSTAAGQTQGKIADLNARGIALPDDLAQRYGLPQGMKMLPEQLDQLVGKVVPAQVRGDTAIKTTGMRTGSNEAIAGANRVQRDQLATDKLNFEKQKNDRDLAMKDAISARSAAVQAGVNPSLAPIKLRQFTDGVSKVQSMHSELDDRQQKIFDAQELLDPETTPDGKAFKDPFTGAPKVMNPDIRDGIANTLSAQKKLQEIQGSVATRQMDQLGITPKAKPAASSGAPASGGGSAQPSGAAADAADIFNHRISPSQLMSQVGGRGMQKTNMVRQIKGELRKLDPNFNWEEAESSYQLTRSPGFQNTVRYMDSVQESMPQLQAAADGLANGNIRSINALVNAGKHQFNNIDVAKFNTDRALVGDEIAKILQGGGTGSGTSDAKLKQAQDLLSSSDSPAAIATTLKEVNQLIGYRRKSLTRGTYLEGQAPQSNPGGGAGGGGQTTVKVISPEGKPGTIPAEKLQEALKRGFKQVQ